MGGGDWSGARTGQGIGNHYGVSVIDGHRNQPQVVLNRIKLVCEEDLAKGIGGDSLPHTFAAKIQMRNSNGSDLS
jgi:hypothetical protein